MLPIVVPIIGPDMETALVDIKKTNIILYGTEIRYDLINNPDIDKLLLTSFNRKTIFTNMRKSEGGKYEGSDEEWQNVLKKALKFEPRYVSVGCDYYGLIKDVREWVPQTAWYNGLPQIIASYHNFNETPENIEEIYYKLKRLDPKPDVVKLATKANSYSDALRILNLIHKAQLERQKIVGLPMGPYGTWVRFVGPKFGSEFTFAALDKSKISGLGQPLVDQLYEGVEILQLP